MCKAFLGSPQYDDINDDVLVNSEHEIFDLSTSDESPLVDFCDLAAPKEVSFIRIYSHSQPRNLIPLVFVFDSCFPDHGVPFSLGYASCLCKAPPWKEQCTFRKAKTQTTWASQPQRSPSHPPFDWSCKRD
jgi:hypothetical protein